MAGSTGRFKSGFGDCAAANAMHGSIAPTRVLISLEFDSHLSGVNQDKISTKKFKTAHNVVSTILRQERKGRESLFSHSFGLSLLIRSISHTSDQAPCSNLTCGEFHTNVLCARRVASNGLFWQTKNGFDAYAQPPGKPEWETRETGLGRQLHQQILSQMPVSRVFIQISQPRNPSALARFKTRNRDKRGKRSLLRGGYRQENPLPLRSIAWQDRQNDTIPEIG